MHSRRKMIYFGAVPITLATPMPMHIAISGCSRRVDVIEHTHCLVVSCFSSASKGCSSEPELEGTEHQCDDSLQLPLSTNDFRARFSTVATARHRDGSSKG